MRLRVPHWSASSGRVYLPSSARTADIVAPSATRLECWRVCDWCATGRSLFVCGPNGLGGGAGDPLRRDVCDGQQEASGGDDPAPTALVTAGTAWQVSLVALPLLIPIGFTPEIRTIDRAGGWQFPSAIPRPRWPMLGRVDKPDRTPKGSAGDPDPWSQAQTLRRPARYGLLRFLDVLKRPNVARADLPRIPSDVALKPVRQW